MKEEKRIPPTTPLIALEQAGLDFSDWVKNDDRALKIVKDCCAKLEQEMLYYPKGHSGILAILKEFQYGLAAKVSAKDERSIKNEKLKALIS